VGNHLFVIFAVLGVSLAVNSCINRSFFTFITPITTVTVKIKVKWIYIAPSRESSKALKPGSHSVACKLHQCLPLPRKRSPDGASPD